MKVIEITKDGEVVKRIDNLSNDPLADAEVVQAIRDYAPCEATLYEFAKVPITKLTFTKP